MKTSVLFRKIHHWGSLALILPLGIMIVAGVLLMLKKEIEWIQPPTQTVETSETAPAMSLDRLYGAALAIPELDVDDWQGFERVDVRADRGIVKFVSPNRWEAQINLTTLEVEQLAYRRSDLIEQIHDGSIFADWVKLFIFLPAGFLLFVLWVTGIYLFFLPHVKRWQRKDAKARRLAELG